MGDPRSALAPLAELAAGELRRPVPEAARRFADEIRRRHGDAVAAVLFYGSCLRKQTDEGVLDFYALVDDYRRAYDGRLLAWANAWLPPNVFYRELESTPEPLRAKYAVLSLRDFARAAGPATLRSGVWARFCQPARYAYLRDEAAAAAIEEGVAAAAVTALGRLLPLLPARPATDPSGDGPGAVQRFDGATFWESAFRATYAAEMRTEPPGAGRALYAADPARYDRLARLALEILAERGELAFAPEAGGLAVRWDPARLRARRRAWKLRRPLAKAVYALQLLKTTTTFGRSWLPYALWKLERHSGVHMEPSERQRRHPFLFGWPLLFEALRRRGFH